MTPSTWIMAIFSSAPFRPEWWRSVSGLSSEDPDWATRKNRLPTTKRKRKNRKAMASDNPRITPKNQRKAVPSTEGGGFGDRRGGTVVPAGVSRSGDGGGTDAQGGWLLMVWSSVERN